MISLQGCSKVPDGKSSQNWHRKTKQNTSCAFFVGFFLPGKYLPTPTHPALIVVGSNFVASAEMLKERVNLGGSMERCWQTMDSEIG